VRSKIDGVEAAQSNANTISTIRFATVGIDRYSLSDLGESMNRIATWELWGQENSSPRRAIFVAVHAPEPDPKSQHGDFRTLVEIDGVSKSRYGYGVNSMQSLVLAMQLLKIHVGRAIDVGWRFYFDENDDEPIDLLHSLSSHLPSSDVPGTNDTVAMS